MRILIPLLAGILLLVGCTDAQIQRAEAISIDADRRLVQAEQATQVAAEALAAAKATAVALDNVEAQRAIAQAEDAVSLASEATDAARQAANGARSAVEAARAAKDAGGASIDVVLAGVVAFVPTLGGLLLAIRKAIESGRALRQTVSGVQTAKEGMKPEDVKRLHDALNKSQDESVKLTVANVKATL
ncbi:MAG: hypothetical protein V4636_13145 [Pseudomonadota bacterium]